LEAPLTQPRAGLGQVQATRKVALLAGLPLLLAAVAFTSAHLFGSGGHELVEAVGRGLLLVCILGRVWCSLYIGGRKNHELIRTGPYSVVRNPLYVFSFIGAAGAGAQSGSMVIAAVALLIAVIVFSLVVRKEEAALIRLHGAQYRDYLASVPRFLPNPMLWRPGGPLRPNAKRVAMTFVDGLVFLLAIPVCEGLEQLQALGYLPSLGGLP